MSEGWDSVATLPELAADALQIWRVDLAAAEESAGESLEVCRKLLTPDEIERAGRFRADQARLQFLVGRACLRVLLSNLLGTSPENVVISLNLFGKPETLMLKSKNPPIHFNIAHSRETVLIALCRQSRVGIDIEYVDRKTDFLKVARSSFTQTEFRQIEAAGTPDHQRRAFFRCWTRKEAVIKADGRGLTLPLTSFEVPVIGTPRFVPVAIAAEPKGETRPETGPKTWFVSDLELGEEIAAAFAVDIPKTRLTTSLFPLAKLHRPR